MSADDALGGREPLGLFSGAPSETQEATPAAAETLPADDLQPDTSQSDRQADSEQADTSPSDSGQSDTSQAETSQSETSQAETVQPNANPETKDLATENLTQKTTKDSPTTPMLAQYFRVKETHPDCLLFFRMGDFFELFFEDAEIAAPILQIQLTHRGTHKDKPVVMCGVPARAADGYLAKLIRQGHRVALCDQVESAEDAKRRGGKQIVRREVVRLVTPGTLLEDSLLEAERNNYLFALARVRGTWGVAWADISTGAFFTRSFAAGAGELAKLSALLVRLEPAEILLTRALLPQEVSGETFQPASSAGNREGEGKAGETGEDKESRIKESTTKESEAKENTTEESTTAKSLSKESPTAERTEVGLEKAIEKKSAATNKLLHLPGSLVREWKQQFTYLEEAQVSPKAGVHSLTAHFKVRDLSAFGTFTEAEMAAAGALLDYAAATTYKAGADHSRQATRAILRPPCPESEGDSLQMDSATRRNLELVRSERGGKRGSLLAYLDRTTTASGTRLLSGWLAAPLTDLEAISARQDMVAWFMARSELVVKLCEALKQVPDLERSVARLAGRRGGPRDLAAVAVGLAQAHKISALLADAGDLPQLGEDSLASLAVLDDLAATLARAVIDLPPLAVRDGDFVRRGYDPRLDDLRGLRDDGARRIAALQEQYIRASGVSSLRIRHNRILGHYIEVSTAQAEKFLAFVKNADKLLPPRGESQPADVFRHRQTMANAVRYGSLALGQLESDLTQAAVRVASLQEEIFVRLAEQVVAEAETLSRLAVALAETDCFIGLSICAVQENWTRPLVDGSRIFVAEAARHPVVEAARTAERETFIANDCRLEDTKRLWLLTGPNMAGKSTFLRQNALLVVLAQMGSFVPAGRFHLGRVRRLFSRVGAADDLARGRSTFMAEMLETAMILNLAGAEDFIILDELGRGTATHDGLSLAWATVEHLHQHNRTRTLFATHYHELTRLADDLPHCFAATMVVREWRGDIVFLHQVRPGAAEGSYGLHVARLAGVPEPVLQRAASLLADFEAGKLPKVSLKSAPPAAVVPLHPVVAAVADLRPDTLSPREALEALYALQGLARAESTPAIQAEAPPAIQAEAQAESEAEAPPAIQAEAQTEAPPEGEVVLRQAKAKATSARRKKSVL